MSKEMQTARTRFHIIATDAPFYNGTPITGRVMTICQPLTSNKAAGPSIFRARHMLAPLTGTPSPGL